MSTKFILNNLIVICKIVTHYLKRYFFFTSDTIGLTYDMIVLTHDGTVDIHDTIGLIHGWKVL